MAAGTKDFLPGDMRARAWLFGLWNRVGEQFGFEMVEGPVLESEDLFVRKAGEEIVGQLYNFQVTKSRLPASCLLTASYQDPCILWHYFHRFWSPCGLRGRRRRTRAGGGWRCALSSPPRWHAWPCRRARASPCLPSGPR